MKTLLVYLNIEFQERIRLQCMEKKFLLEFDVIAFHLPKAVLKRL